MTKKPEVRAILHDKDLKLLFKRLKVSAQASNFLARPNNGYFLVTILPRLSNCCFNIKSNYARRTNRETFKKLIEETFDDHTFYELVLVTAKDGFPQLRIRQV